MLSSSSPSPSPTASRVSRRIHSKSYDTDGDVFVGDVETASDLLEDLQTVGCKDEILIERLEQQQQHEQAEKTNNKQRLKKGHKNTDGTKKGARSSSRRRHEPDNNHRRIWNTVPPTTARANTTTTTTAIARNSKLCDNVIIQDFSDGRKLLQELHRIDDTANHHNVVDPKLIEHATQAATNHNNNHRSTSLFDQKTVNPPTDGVIAQKDDGGDDSSITTLNDKDDQVEGEDDDDKTMAYDDVMSQSLANSPPHNPTAAARTPTTFRSARRRYRNNNKNSPVMAFQNARENNGNEKTATTTPTASSTTRESRSATKTREGGVLDTTMTRSRTRTRESAAGGAQNTTTRSKTKTALAATATLHNLRSQRYRRVKTRRSTRWGSSDEDEEGGEGNEQESYDDSSEEEEEEEEQEEDHMDAMDSEVIGHHHDDEDDDHDDDDDDAMTDDNEDEDDKPRVVLLREKYSPKRNYKRARKVSLEFLTISKATAAAGATAKTPERHAQRSRSKPHRFSEEKFPSSRKQRQHGTSKRRQHHRVERNEEEVTLLPGGPKPSREVRGKGNHDGDHEQTAEVPPSLPQQKLRQSPRKRRNRAVYKEEAENKSSSEDDAGDADFVVDDNGEDDENPDSDKEQVDDNETEVIVIDDEEEGGKEMMATQGSVIEIREDGESDDNDDDRVAKIPPSSSKRKQSQLQTKKKNKVVYKEESDYKSSSEDDTNDLDFNPNNDDDEDDDDDDDQHFYGDYNDKADDSDNVDHLSDDEKDSESDVDVVSTGYLGDDYEPPEPLSEEEKEVALSKLDHVHDRALQHLLWSIGFRMALLPHQPQGVRFVVGLPNTFPLQGLDLSTKSIEEVEEISKHITLKDAMINLARPETMGVCLSDDMGLGKTIQTIAGIIIRNAIVLKNGPYVHPSLIVCPNDAIVGQWVDALLNNLVPQEQIVVIETWRQLGGDWMSKRFVLMTIHTLSAEVRQVFRQQDDDDDVYDVMCIEFDSDLIRKLKVLKRCKDKTQKCALKREGEEWDDCVTRLIKEHVQREERTSKAKLPNYFGAFVIDEAHFLRGRLTFWSIGAALVGIHAARTIALTGTPYCNKGSDVAAIQSYLDIQHEAASSTWWDKVLFRPTNQQNQAAIAWRNSYLLRRKKDDILKDLPERIIETIGVGIYPAELEFYEQYEKQFLSYMELVGNSAASVNRLPDHQVRVIMLSLSTLMRACVIHPTIPGARELTVQFSPTRKDLVQQFYCQKVCAICQQRNPPRAEDKDSQMEELRYLADGYHLLEGEDSPVANGRRTNARLDDNDMTEFVPMPSDLCWLKDKDQQPYHVAHKMCLVTFRAMQQNTGLAKCCPRCHQLNERLLVTTKTNYGGKRYCKEVQPLGSKGNAGFVASSKIQRIVDWFQNEVPKSDKVIVYSFYKGALDLLEGIFAHDLAFAPGVGYLRYDGDVPAKQRVSLLRQFKDDARCRVLFASVQSCGIGLNICAANHVAFIDRWYNPVVHDQAMDRCHRIGQTKTVHVKFFDCVVTCDAALAILHQAKKNNARIVLGPGFDIGVGAKDISPKELNGLMNRLLMAFQAERTRQLIANGESAKLQKLDGGTLEKLEAEVESKMAR